MGGLLLAPLFLLIFGLRGPEIQQVTRPNQGIFKTIQNAIIIGLIYSLFFLLLGGLFSHSNVGLILAAIFGLIGMLMGGGAACTQHFSLRFILSIHGYAPWNYARFLDYSADRLFLQKVGGGYIFVHRMLLEHFAAMNLEQR